MDETIADKTEISGQETKSKSQVKAKYKVMVESEEYGKLVFMVIADPTNEEKSIADEIEWRAKKYDIRDASIVEYKRCGNKEN